MTRILVVEDEKRLADALCYILEREEYFVDVAHDGKSALQLFECQGEYDLVMLDIMLPGIQGLDLLSLIRKKDERTPILMLTALSQTSDKVAGLDRGADDYLTKPFQAEELLARIRALTRRSGDVVLDELCAADLTLNINSRRLCTGVGDVFKEVKLSEKEFEVLSYLMRNTGRVISKEQLILHIWGVNSYVEDNNVEAYISFLRKKLRFLDSTVAIETIRSAGYILSVDSGNEG